MSTIPQKPIVEAIHCRWKHLRGVGREALYRASCGQPRCPGHLGDLHFLAEIEDQPEFLADLSRRWKEHYERAIQRGEPWANELVAIEAEDRREDLAVFQAEAEEMWRAAGEMVGDARSGHVRLITGWMMSATPLHGRGGFNDAQPVYRGHQDTGYRITFSGKRSRDGDRIGRRPLLRQAPRWVNTAFGGSRLVQGQTVRLEDQVWCPACGTLNRLDWPESLRDCET